MPYVVAIRDLVTTAELRDDPHPLFAALRRDAPVWALPHEPAFLVSTWDLVVDAAKRVHDFSNHFRYTLHTRADGGLGAMPTGALGPDVFAGADPPEHTAHRRIFFSELVQRRIAALEPDVVDATDELLDAWIDGGDRDAATSLSHQLPLRVVAERVIGFEDTDLDRLRGWVFDGARLSGGMLTLDEIAALAGDLAPMASWVEDQLARASHRDRTDDVLGAAAAAVRDGTLTPDEAAFTLMVLVGAGAETTTALLGLAVDRLARHVDVQAGLRADPSGIPDFVEEVLRLDCPFRFHPRTAARDTVLGGVEIAEGSLVLLLWASANRDDAVFGQPDELRVGRRDVHLHTAFGRGVHHCVGAALARLEARVVVERILARTKWLAPSDAAVTWSDSIWIHRHDHLPVVVEPA